MDPCTFHMLCCKYILLMTGFMISDGFGPHSTCSLFQVSIVRLIRLARTQSATPHGENATWVATPLCRIRTYASELPYF